MKLRVVSGTLKGRVVTVPPRDAVFRPTRERVREGVADILSSRIAGAVVADVCAGSGIFGFEMISRGAQRVVFVENDQFRCRLIREHAERFGVEKACRIVAKEIQAFVDCCNDRFDIVFCDPPYDDYQAAEKVPSLFRLLVKGGILIHERRAVKGKQPQQPIVGVPQPFDRRIYGETEICLFTTTEG